MTRPITDVEEWALNVASTGRRDWTHMGGSLIVNAMGTVGDPGKIMWPSVADAVHSSPIESTNSEDAPAGAIHFWLSRPDGAAGIDLVGAGLRVLHNIRRSQNVEYLGKGLSISATEDVDLQYLGWSREYGGHQFDELKPVVAPTGLVEIEDREWTDAEVAERFTPIGELVTRVSLMVSQLVVLTRCSTCYGVVEEAFQRDHLLEWHRLVAAPR